MGFLEKLGFGHKKEEEQKMAPPAEEAKAEMPSAPAEEAPMAPPAEEAEMPEEETEQM